jgi:hypothetical protein
VATGLTKNPGRMGVKEGAVDTLEPCHGMFMRDVSVMMAILFAVSICGRFKDKLRLVNSARKVRASFDSLVS